VSAQDVLEAPVHDDVPPAPAGLGPSVLTEYPTSADADPPVVHVDVPQRSAIASDGRVPVQKRK
jgi:hypothetical protein